MNANLMKRYVVYLNDARTNNIPAMLVYDSFRGHIEESVKLKFRKIEYNLAVISGGLTSILPTARCCNQ